MHFQGAGGGYHVITSFLKQLGRQNHQGFLWFSSQHARFINGMWKQANIRSQKWKCVMSITTDCFSFLLCNRTSHVLTLTVGVTTTPLDTHTQIRNPSPMCVDTGQTCPAGRHGPAYESPLPPRLENRKKKNPAPRFASTSSPSTTNGTNKRTPREVAHCFFFHKKVKQHSRNGGANKIRHSILTATYLVTGHWPQDGGSCCYCLCLLSGTSMSCCKGHRGQEHSWQLVSSCSYMRCSSVLQIGPWMFSV